MSLFPELEPPGAPDIPGLSYAPDFVTAEEEVELIAAIDAAPWITELKRRVQHYGYRYDYKARSVTPEAYLGLLPDWLHALVERLTARAVFPTPPDQAIVNEYIPGQGISAHVDCVPCFGGVIASLSLGSGAVMQFSELETGREQPIYLDRRSLVVLSGAARYQWRHAVPARKSDRVGGGVRLRERRLSITLRTVLLAEPSA